MYYFAYGSNMNFDHMRKLCGWHFTVLGIGTLNDFNLAVDLRGYINIKNEPGSKVLGVLYNIDQQALDVLDEFEGVPYVFQRINVPIIDEDGTTVDAWVYSKGDSQYGGDFVKEEFLNRVLIGARENHLPEEWIKFLESFKTTNG